MAEVLHLDDDPSSVRALAAPGAVLDPATAQVLEQAVAEAEERGRRDGERAGREAAAAEVARAVTAVTDALEHVTRELTDARVLAAATNLDAVRTVAEAVLGRTPPAEALEVLDRVRAAVDLLDADRMEVRLHPIDHQVLDDAVDDDRLQLVADPKVAQGDAVVGTSVAGARLTRAALLEAALRAVTEEGAP